MGVSTTTLIFDLLARDGASATLARVGFNATSASRRVAALGAGLTSVGRRMTTAFTVPVVLAGAASVKMATDFDSAMTRVQTQAGGSARDVRTLTQQILALGGKVQQTPLQLADAMYHLKSVGLDNVQAMKALVQASHLASVGNADLEDTTNAVAGAWRSGIRGAQSFHGAVKTLNAIIGAGNMTMDQLNDAIGTGFLPSARTFGVSLHDIGSALAVMTDEGIPANSAATRLRMSLSLLGAPSQTAANWLATIGIKSKQLGNDMRSGGLVKAFGDLKEHLAGLSKTGQAFLLSKAFGGGRSSSAIMTLLNNFTVLQRKEGQITAGMDKFNKSVTAQGQTPQARFKELVSILATLGVKIGTELLPYVIKGVTWISNLVTSFTQLSAPVKKAAGIFVLVLAAAGPVLTILGGLTSAIALLLTPIGLAVAAVAGLGVAFVLAYRRSDSFRAWVQDSLVPTLKTFGSWVMSTGLPAVEAFGQKIGNNLAPAAQTLGTEFRKSLPTIKQFIQDVRVGAPPIIKLTGALIVLASAVLGKVLPPLFKLSAFLDRVLLQNLGLAIHSLGDASHAVMAFGGWLVDGAHKAGQFASAVGDKIGQAMAYVKTIPARAKAAVGNLGGLLVGAGEALVGGLLSGIRKKATGLLSYVGGLAGSVASAFKNPLGISSPSKVFQGYGENILDGLMKGIGNRMIPLQNVLARVVSAVQAAGQKLHGLISDRNSFAAGFQDFGTSVFGADYGTDVNGNPNKPTASSIIAYQRQQDAQAAKLKHEIHKLVRMGLSPSLIKQLQAQGAAGLPEIEALAGGSEAQIRRLNRLNKQTHQNLAGAGATAARGAGFDKQIAVERHEVDHLKNIEDTLKELLKHANKDERLVIYDQNGNWVIKAQRKQKRRKGAAAGTT